MPKITKIYTRTGDTGTTGLTDGSRTEKDSLRIATIGDIDELNSCLGITRTFLLETDHLDTLEIIGRIQNELFDLGAELATPAGKEWQGMIKISEDSVKYIEDTIDSISEKIPPLKNFVLPGGSMTNAFLHQARTICRRAERLVTTLSKIEKISPEIVKYVNRLSDLLFAMARYEALRDHKQEFLWIPGKK